MSTINGLIPNSPYALTGSGAGSFIDASQVAVAESTTEVSQASVSLSANLNGVSAGTAAGELTLQFAQALQSATTVDPSTGQRELASGADAQLTATFSALLEQNGFSSSQASTAANSLEIQLAQGGQVDLAASYAQTGSVSGSITSAYGTGAASSVSAIASTQRAGSIEIGINLATGELSVDLSSQNISSYQAQGQISGSGNLAGPVAQALVLPGTATQNSGDVLSLVGGSALDTLTQGLGLSLPDSLGGSSGLGALTAASPLSESGSEVSVLTESVTATLIDIGATTYSGDSGGDSGSDAGGPAGGAGSGSGLDLAATQSGALSTAGDSATAAAGTQAQAETTTSVLQQLVAELNSARVLGQQEVAGLLQGLAQLSAHASGANGATDKGADSTADASDTAADGGSGATGLNGLTVASGYASISIGIVQTLTVQQLDGNGYGSTLYQRPDGSLGAVTTSPLSLTA